MDPQKKPVKLSLACVIYDGDGKRFLIVRRPDDDGDLPGVWGLPAGSVGDDEAYGDAVLRCGREKLGVALRIKAHIGNGDLEREGYVLHLEEYEAEIVSGVPRVPQQAKGITQYTALRWGALPDIMEAARKGSLCSRILLESRGAGWES